MDKNTKVYAVGKQYYPDDPFKKKARYHQSLFRTKVLGIDRYDEYGNRLIEEDAKRGLNFFPKLGILEEVRRRYPAYKRALYADMLRSEHIPFNIFIPLKKDSNLARLVLSDLINDSIMNVDRIEIEYAPKPKEDYLDDATSFDVYIEYTRFDDAHGIMGIEVKYTEHDYALREGSKEERFVTDPKSPYNWITSHIDLYRSDKIGELAKDEYRQMWRNQLLGESILLKQKPSFKHFSSIILHPAKNKHFVDVASEYKTFFKPSIPPNRFLSITFEAFFDQVDKHVKGIENTDYSLWVQYLEQRYLFDF